MSDNISYISLNSNNDDPYLDEPMTLFEKIEQKTMKNRHNQTTNNKDFTPKKNSKTIGYEIYDGEYWMNTDNSSKNKFYNKNKLFLEDTQNKFIDNSNDSNNHFIPSFENNSLLGSWENPNEDLIKLENLNINKNKYSTGNNLLGIKRKLEKKNKSIKENLFEEIKNLFNEYNNKYVELKEKIPSFKIFEEFDGIMNSHATIIENKIPGCIIYFYKDAITNIYLINEGKFIKKENEISKVLNEIKSNILKLQI